MSFLKIWGITSDEIKLEFSCDKYMDNCDDIWFRGITINASPETIFRWLCQMRVAPYSYDWIDNFGRQSPQNLIPGLEKLELGQKVMFIFEVIDFATNDNLTIRLNKKALHHFGK